ncbi:MAG: PD40 domain-containing protein [Polyangiaceae bacterium]|nr:PD40 domain-containing protein [Polyangiaceae bacterium]
MPWRPWCLLVLSSIAACAADAERAPAPSSPPELGAEDARVVEALRDASARGDDLLLDVDARRALSAEARPTSAHEHAFVPLRVTLIEGGEQKTLGLALDGRLLPGGDEVLLVSIDGGLWRWSSRRVAPLEDEVVPGLALSPDGARLAYAKGDPPELDVWEIDLRDGTRRRVTSGDGPEHAPAYSADGATLAWIEYRGDGAALVSAGRTVVPRVPVIPDGRRTPVWGRGWVWLHGSGGTVAVEEVTGRTGLDLGAGGDVIWSANSPVFRSTSGEVRAMGGAR